MNWWSRVVQQDLKSIADQAPIPNSPRNFLLTGGTGMLLKYLPVVLLNKTFSSQSDQQKIFLLTRNVERARQIFSNLIDNSNFHILPLRSRWQEQIGHPIHILIHGAGAGSPTQVQSPQDDILFPNVDMTRELLDFARHQELSSFVFISSGIVYGSNPGIRSVKEEDLAKLNHTEHLSNYQEAKTLAENLGLSYFAKFGVPFKIVRPAHCYGPTTNISKDNRLASFLIRNALVGKHIDFKGNTLSMRSFVYITDAVSGIFHVEKNGVPGEAYNLFSTRDFVSVEDFIHILTQHIRDLDISLQSKLAIKEGLYMSPDKLEKLGWSPRVNLEQGIERTMRHFSEEI